MPCLLPWTPTKQPVCSLSPFSSSSSPFFQPDLCLSSSCAVIFGEDVAFGGVFRCTVDLMEKYGLAAFLRFGCKRLPSSDDFFQERTGCSTPHSASRVLLGLELGWPRWVPPPLPRSSLPTTSFPPLTRLGFLSLSFDGSEADYWMKQRADGYFLSHVLSSLSTRPPSTVTGQETCLMSEA